MGNRIYMYMYQLMTHFWETKKNSQKIHIMYMVYNRQIKRGQKNNYRTKNKPVCIYIIYHSNQSLLTVCNELSVHLDTGGQS